MFGEEHFASEDSWRALNSEDSWTEDQPFRSWHRKQLINDSASLLFQSSACTQYLYLRSFLLQYPTEVY